MKVLIALFLSLFVIAGCERDDAPLPSSHAAQVAAQPRVIADGWMPNLPSKPAP